MLLAGLPHPVRILILMVVGAIVGAFINWGIYAWTYFLKRPISPWMKPAEQASSRTMADRIPVFGWLSMRRDEAVHGKWFWIRPMLIELAWFIGLPLFYNWQIRGGLTSGTVTPDFQSETWFYTHAILLCFMCIATFIDFDERTIPDWVTIPGTLIGLGIAAGCPWYRLPENVVVGMAGLPKVEHMHLGSPAPEPTWQFGTYGLVFALVVFAIWIFALLPKICTMRYGLIRGCKIMFASIIRPKRKLPCEIRTEPRGPFGITYLLLFLGVLGLVSIWLAKQYLPAANWNSLFGAIYGLAFAGGMIWGVRIVARFAMQREAMGFGDVTLMAMIGAFLGWQASILTFVIAPFAAIAIVLVNAILTKENELAFGPYLCFGAFLLIVGWTTIWPQFLMHFQLLGRFAVPGLIGALILMAVMLAGIQWLKGGYSEEEFEESEA